MIRNMFIIVFSIFIFAGCAVTQPDIPNYSIKITDKVGYVLSLKNDNIEHTHYGTTVFNNSNKTYKYKWNVEDFTKETLNSNINSKLVDLSTYSITSADVNDLIIAKDDKWIVNKTEIYNKLVNELGLKAVIVINEKPGGFFQYPYNYSVKGSGLLSHHVLGMKRYFSILAFSSDIHLLKPTAKIKVNNQSLVSLIRDPMLSSFEKKSGFKVPVNIDKITEEEMKPLVKSLEELIRLHISIINKKIK